MADIYAVGDAVVTKNQINQTQQLTLLASPANRAGRQLADLLSGISNFNKGNISTAIIRIFDTTIGMTGLNERQLEEKTYETIHLLSNDHASYFPGATPIHLKVLFDPKTHHILGAQAVGKHGIDKRIDIKTLNSIMGKNIIDEDDVFDKFIGRMS